MHNNELISVIIPVYNAEQYLEDCIGSICNQSYKNFELILVNDGSVDSSLSICKKCAGIDKRIKVIERSNGGAGAARNSGMKVMQGAYVVFVDSDDYVNSDYLRNLYQAAKVNDYDIVQCGMKKTKGKKRNDLQVSYKAIDVKEISKKKALNGRVYNVGIWGKIYSRKVIGSFRFNEGKIYEDEAAYYRLVDRADKIAVLNETLYYYYASDNSVMRNDKENKSLYFLNVFEDRLAYFYNKNDMVLMEGTYGRICISIMLFLSGILTNGNNKGDINYLLGLFDKYYKLAIRSKYVNLKDKCMLRCFHISPKKIGSIIGKIRG